MSQAYLKRLALLMAVNCVRNTVIEDYHAAGKLDDPEMKAFYQEVANETSTRSCNSCYSKRTRIETHS